MEQTFPAEAIRRVVISDVSDDLSVEGWSQQAIKVACGETISQLVPEGETLLISGCDDALKLWVPYEVSIVAHRIQGDVEMNNVLHVEVAAVDGDIAVKDLNGDLRVDHCASDITLTNIKGNVSLDSVGGDLTAKRMDILQIPGPIGGDAVLNDVRSLRVGPVGGDLALRDVQECIAANVGGDLVSDGNIATLQAGSIDGDCTLKHAGNAQIQLSVVNGDFTIDGGSEVKINYIAGDATFSGGAQCVIALFNVDGDFTVVGASSVQVGNVSSDCTLRDIQGDVTLGAIGSDVTIMGVVGDVQLAGVGGDATLEGIGGRVQIASVGGDLSLKAAFATDEETHVVVGGDAMIQLPESPNLTISASVGGEISGRSIPASRRGSVVNLVYGEGLAKLTLQVGGDLQIRSNEGPRNSSTSSSAWGWESFEQDMAQFSMEMGRLGEELGRTIENALRGTAPVGQDISHKVEEQLRRARLFTQKQEQKAAKLARQASKQAGKVHVRINDREWRMDDDRIQRMIDQASRAAAEGVYGALDAVEQALRNLHIPLPPKYGRPSTPPTPPSPAEQERMQPPVPPVPPAEQERMQPPVPPVPPSLAEQTPGEKKEAANIEQEREAILRMIAEGRITPEEGDMLLEALADKEHDK
ncbi:hypothetical protein EI42_03921 [Thermosporothrix hazakensis]|jgi:DUF4097 and DUF4098 domain-containing protein YvlB|uniref:YvlB/LiaX N-terminal domain-containing protein n=1 Tax=Thermosporothrix hazakensis TaxID=644383 RepID=A0A326U3Y8_THEHA|nr:hypothetical protein [Thermosporothrix hazakensis]PZW26341.1 hypothetical protein EI42_03921 [Thermosporothrix hazakensis]GCE48708.1 hypothetical protein KTH_35770 [Thermosporothrix hazakensis]